jgi:putative tryptophan/tyrosine transport system substrate-binding protein
MVIFFESGRTRLIAILSLMLIGLFALICSPVYALEKKRIVVIQTMPVPACEAHLKWFVTHLEDLGYKDGQNMELIVIKANGDYRIAEEGLARVLDKGKPDAVATIATLASQAAYKVLKGTNVPIFFFQVSDPVGAGLVKELGHPTGTNITGRVFTVPSDIRVDMVLRLVGQTKKERPVRFGYIHSTYPSSMGDLRNLREIAGKRTDTEFLAYELEYQRMPVGISEMLHKTQKGIGKLSGRIDFWWEPQGPLGETEEYARMLNTTTKPVAMGQTLQSVRQGALLNVTPDLMAGGREAAQVVDAFLKGAKPGSMPVTPPTRFQVGLNLTTAINLNIVIPEDILELAQNSTFR